MKLEDHLRGTTENDIEMALASGPVGRWPQDEGELLALFNLILDWKIGVIDADAGVLQVPAQAIS
ncbi:MULTISPECIES: hypothetical protein [Novosphingobium]|uniref:hypothetical protein n=1 Tax=Novosphingobium TaxID=165696 RepID=UPI0022F25E4A|nr:hypothetical protein [Novosphingobium resinovorum]GLK44991.1 hypothetical protein GCM10017612_29110 [Novosphingobium resinovorum]